MSCGNVVERSVCKGVLRERFARSGALIARVCIRCGERHAVVRCKDCGGEVLPRDGFFPAEDTVCERCATLCRTCGGLLEQRNSKICNACAISGRTGNLGT